jgi:hypothetical protein
MVIDPAMNRNRSDNALSAAVPGSWMKADR